VRMLTQKMEMTVEVNLAPDDGEGSADEIRIEIEGPDAGRIIGKKGNVLDALQYLTARVAVRPGSASASPRHRRRRGVSRPSRRPARANGAAPRPARGRPRAKSSRSIR
jgi:predicted RNA-binding protein YlqC (UPF0109 family)